MSRVTDKAKGYIFGSFNPIHNGHLTMAIDVLKNKLCDNIVFVPAKQNPFKKAYNVSDTQRIDMIDLAIKSCGLYSDKMSINDIEINSNILDGKTYNTIKALNDPNHLFICGTDTYYEIHKWYKGDEILKEENFIIFNRNEANDISIKMDNIVAILCNDTILNISSTNVRERIKNNMDIYNYVPTDVANYILAHGLYLN